MFTSSHHPQSNGAAERVVQTLKCMLDAKVAGAIHDWRFGVCELREWHAEPRTSGAVHGQQVKPVQGPQRQGCPMHCCYGCIKGSSHARRCATSRLAGRAIKLTWQAVVQATAGNCGICKRLCGICKRLCHTHVVVYARLCAEAVY